MIVAEVLLVVVALVLPLLLGAGAAMMRRPWWWAALIAVTLAFIAMVAPQPEPGESRLATEDLGFVLLVLRTPPTSPSAPARPTCRPREAGLVETRRDGKRIYYSLVADDVARLWDNLRRVALRHRPHTERALAAYLGPEDTEAVTTERLLARISDGEVVVLDVRPEPEYASGHLPGAVHTPVEELTNASPTSQPTARSSPTAAASTAYSHTTLTPAEPTRLSSQPRHRRGTGASLACLIAMICSPEPRQFSNGPRKCGAIPVYRVRSTSRRPHCERVRSSSRHWAIRSLR